MTCGSCGAEIVWAKTTNGGRIPVDAVPAMEGAVLLTKRDGEDLAQVLAGEQLEEARLVNVALRTSHFITCPDAGAWRNR